jgi:hypothetical protein
MTDRRGFFALLSSLAGALAGLLVGKAAAAQPLQAGESLAGKLAPMEGPINGVGVLHYPVQFFKREDSSGFSSVDEAKKIAQSVQRGSVILLPSDRDADGNYLWDFRVEGGPFGQLVVEHDGEHDRGKTERMGSLVCQCCKKITTQVISLAVPSFTETAEGLSSMCEPCAWRVVSLMCALLTPAQGERVARSMKAGIDTVLDETTAALEEQHQNRFVTHVIEAEGTPTQAALLMGKGLGPIDLTGWKVSVRR